MPGGVDSIRHHLAKDSKLGAPRHGDDPPTRSTGGVGLTDDQLMMLLKNGNSDALGQLYVRHGSLVRKVLHRLGPRFSESDVDELCQEVFITLNDTAPRFQDGKNFRGWLYGIAANKARKWRYEKWYHQSLMRRHGGKYPGLAMPTKITHDHKLEIQQAVDQAVASLSQKLREVFVLHAVEGFSAEEIAQMFDVSEQVVWTRVHRARKKLMELLEPELLAVTTGA